MFLRIKNEGRHVWKLLIDTHSFVLKNTQNKV